MAARRRPLQRSAWTVAWHRWRWIWFGELVLFLLLAIIGLALVPAKAGDGPEHGHADLRVWATPPADRQQSAGVNYTVFVDTGPGIEVTNVTVTLLNAHPIAPQPVEIQQSSTVGRGSMVTITIAVGENAVAGHFVLSGDAGTLGLNDLTLDVTAPGGQWSSSNPGTSERVDLTAVDMQQGGPGDWTIVIRHAGGVRAISFAFDAKIEFGVPLLTQSAGPVPAESGTSLSWSVSLPEGEAERTEADVRAVVVPAGHGEAHAGGSPTVVLIHLGPDGRPVFGSGKYTSGAWTGSELYAVSALGVYIAAVTTGASSRLRGILGRLLRRENQEDVHGAIGMAVAAIAFAHGTVQIATGDTDLFAQGILFGTFAAAVLLLVILSGLFKPEMAKESSRGTARVFHASFGVLTGVLLVTHAFYIGRHLGIVPA